MPKYIDREKVYKKMVKDLEAHNDKPGSYRWKMNVQFALNYIDDVPDEDVVPVEKAKWEFESTRGFVCSRCHEAFIATSKYCSECGAKMENANGD